MLAAFGRYYWRMRRGYSLAELAVVLAVLGVVTAVTLPRLWGWLDWVAVDRAAVEVSTALAVARSAAVFDGSRSRLLIAADSLRIDRRAGGSGGPQTAWQPYARWPGPAQHGVALEVSNPEVVFMPSGIAWGLSNTRVVLRRGPHVATITVSRVGRVKRW